MLGPLGPHLGIQLTPPVESSLASTESTIKEGREKKHTFIMTTQVETLGVGPHLGVMLTVWSSR